MLGKTVDTSVFEGGFDDWDFNERSSPAGKKVDELVEKIEKCVARIKSDLAAPLLKHGAMVFAEEAIRNLTVGGLTFDAKNRKLFVGVQLTDGCELSFDLLENLMDNFSERQDKDEEEKRHEVVRLLREIANKLEK